MQIARSITNVYTGRDRYKNGGRGEPKTRAIYTLLFNLILPQQKVFFFLLLAGKLVEPSRYYCLVRHGRDGEEETRLENGFGGCMRTFYDCLHTPAASNLYCAEIATDPAACYRNSHDFGTTRWNRGRS